MLVRIGPRNLVITLGNFMNYLNTGKFIYSTHTCNVIWMHSNPKWMTV